MEKMQVLKQLLQFLKKYPLMSGLSIIIIKEAQDLGNTIENSDKLFKNPLSSTILVINYKHNHG